MTSIAVTGATGRMGSRILALAAEDPQIQVVAAITRGDAPAASAGGQTPPFTRDLQAAPSVLIDFTSPASMRHWLSVCRQRRIAMLIGTTGLSPSDESAIDEASKEIAVLQATNMSLGVALLNRFAADLARQLGDDYDIEIVESHHRFKKDAPSGTAMTLAKHILRATGKSDEALVFDRHGEEAARQRGQIGMHSLRLGDEVGRHTAIFAGLGERLELTHVATSRDTFARGALRAAKWLGGQKPGRYSIADVLGLKQTVIR